MTSLAISPALAASDRSIGSPVVNQAEIHADSLARVGESIAAIGGYGEVFARLPRSFEWTFSAQLDDLLQRPWYNSGLTNNGEAWAFTAEEIARIKAFAPKYLAQYRQASASADVSVLSLQDPAFAGSISVEPGVFVIEIGGPSVQPTWEPPVLAEELDQLLVERVAYYVGATDAEFSASVATVGAEGAEGAEGAPALLELSLPVFKYPTELRAQAPQILSTSQSADRVWLYEPRKAVHAEFSALLDEASGGAFSALELDGSDAEAQRWILDNRDVLGAVSSIVLQ